MPLAKPKEYHVQIDGGYNPTMKAHALRLIVGGFKTEADMKAYIERLREFLESEANATFQRVQ